MERRAVVAAMVLALLAALVVVGVRWGEQPDPAASPGGPSPTHTVVVRTELLGPRVHYIEGALVRVGLWPDGESDWYDAQRSDPMSVGEGVTWTGVPAGSHDLVGEVYPCNGNCGELALATDRCTLQIDLTADVEVVVRFRWGSPCTGEVTGA